VAELPEAVVVFPLAAQVTLSRGDADIFSAIVMIPVPCKSKEPPPVKVVMAEVIIKSPSASKVIVELIVKAPVWPNLHDPDTVNDCPLVENVPVYTVTVVVSVLQTDAADNEQEITEVPLNTTSSEAVGWVPNDQLAPTSQSVDADDDQVLVATAIYPLPFSNFFPKI
jgi:hypothetical protein